MVKVWNVRVWDHMRGCNVVTPTKYTEEGIAAIRGDKLDETEEDVEEAHIDGQWRYKCPSKNILIRKSRL